MKMACETDVFGGVYIFSLKSSAISVDIVDGGTSDGTFVDYLLPPPVSPTVSWCNFFKYSC